MNILFKRGTAEQLDAYTGEAGEMLIDTTNQRVRIFDGSTQGGHELGKVEDILTEEQILQLTNDASNLTEGTLDNERLDIHEVFGKARIRKHDSGEFWYTDAGTLAPVGPTSFGSNVSEIWSFDQHTDTVHELSVSHKPPLMGMEYTVHSAGLDNYVYAIDGDGFDIGMQSGDYPTMAITTDKDGGYGYFGTAAGQLVKRDHDGNNIWTFTGHQESESKPGVHGIAIGTGGDIYSAGEDGTLRKIDSDGNEVWKNEDHDSPLNKIASDSSGNVYTTSDDGTVRKIDSDGNEVWKFEGHTDSVRDVAVSSDGSVFSVSRDQTLRKIDSSGVEVWSYDEPGEQINGVDVDKYGYAYIAGNGGVLQKISSDGSKVWEFTGHDLAVMTVVVDDEDGNVYSGGEDTTVRRLEQTD